MYDAPILEKEMQIHVLYLLGVVVVVVVVVVVMVLFFIPLIIFALLFSLSLLFVATQIRGHVA